jgi:hypothetical protein
MAVENRRIFRIIGSVMSINNGQICIEDLDDYITGVKTLCWKDDDGVARKAVVLGHGATLSSLGMTGDIDMDEHDIVNVGLVDGVDVPNHKLRHIRGGNDEIDGDKLDVDWDPSNYTPDTSPDEVDNVDHLTAHLKGIDDAIGSGGVSGLTDKQVLYGNSDGSIDQDANFKFEDDVVGDNGSLEINGDGDFLVGLSVGGHPSIIEGNYGAGYFAGGLEVDNDIYCKNKNVRLVKTFTHGSSPVTASFGSNTITANWASGHVQKVHITADATTLVFSGGPPGVANGLKLYITADGSYDIGGGSGFNTVIWEDTGIKLNTTSVPIHAAGGHVVLLTIDYDGTNYRGRVESFGYGGV